MKKVLIEEYGNLVKIPKQPLKIKNHTSITFVNEAKVEITGKDDRKYNIKFFDRSNDKLVHQSDISNNMWTKTNYRYFIDYKIVITDLEDNSETIHYFDAKDKKVYIHFASKALGDTIAWFPYAEEFMKKHKCKMVVSTFHNDMFESNYPDIEFVNPGTTVYDLYAMYEIGWHYNEDGEVNHFRNKSDFRKIGLQTVSSETLGLEDTEIKPKLTYKKGDSTIDGKYVVIAPHGSALAKYWNYEGGWQEVVDNLNNRGYKVVMITKEPLGDAWHDSKLGGTLQNVIDKTGDFPLSERANDIMNADAFIGIGSGLSWLSWACNTPTVLISGFSEPYSEFKDCERIGAPEGKCGGCFNRHRLDAGDWKWCPDHKDTDRMFECTTSITPEMVINKLNNILN
jgi:autotransporter strand-loop-strand O-heptosyltransferase